MSDQMECRSENGITEGLVDALISIVRVLSKRDMSPNNVQGALIDFLDDDDFKTIQNARLID